MMWILLLGAAPRVATAWQANWMGDNAAVLGGSTLLDLSLPGTHDALSHDLPSSWHDETRERHEREAQLPTADKGVVTIPLMLSCR